MTVSPASTRRLQFRSWCQFIYLLDARERPTPAPQHRGVRQMQVRPDPGPFRRAGDDRDVGIARQVHQQLDEDVLQDRIHGRFSPAQSFEVDLSAARRSRNERERCAVWGEFLADALAAVLIEGIASTFNRAEARRRREAMYRIETVSPAPAGEPRRPLGRANVTGLYRTRRCSRYSIAARIWPASHVVQSSLSGSPGTPVPRPTATSLTTRCCEPWCSHRARNRCVRATEGSSFTHEHRSPEMAGRAGGECG